MTGAQVFGVVFFFGGLTMGLFLIYRAEWWSKNLREGADQMYPERMKRRAKKMFTPGQSRLTGAGFIVIGCLGGYDSFFNS